MATTSEDEELDFEQGMLWLTSHVLDEAFDQTKTEVMNHRQKQQQQQQQQQQVQVQNSSLPTTKYYDSRRGSRWLAGPKISATRASGGPGMQAIFIDSGKRSSGGTGVFLPQRTGTGTGTAYAYQPSKKPACAPVLIPARVVQALNLDVHALGLQISSCQEPKSISNCRGVENQNRNKKDDDFTVHSLLSSANHSSPELFLPKEWTY